MKLSIILRAASLGLTSAAPSSDLIERAIEKRACFKSGAKFGPLRDAARRQAEKHCREYYEGTYERGNTYTRESEVWRVGTESYIMCIEFKVGLKGKNAPKKKYLGYTECVSGLRNEIVSCDRGGQTTYGNCVDPNEGGC
ncbi:hypothetical protein CC79DRAFT_1398248 [Sarocladium strictum]